MKKTLVAALCLSMMMGSAIADTKVGIVIPQKILATSQPAKDAQAELQKIFKPRQTELDRLVRDFKAKAAKYEKDKAILSQAENAKQRKELGDAEVNIQRKQRSLMEESNQKRNELLQKILSEAQKIVADLAKKGGYDLIVQDAIWFNNKIDLTDQVIAQLNKVKIK